MEYIIYLWLLCGFSIFILEYTITKSGNIIASVLLGPFAMLLFFGMLASIEFLNFCDFDEVKITNNSIKESLLDKHGTPIRKGDMVMDNKSKVYDIAIHKNNICYAIRNKRRIPLNKDISKCFTVLVKQ